jgi:hypothetical protein
VQPFVDRAVVRFSVYDAKRLPCAAAVHAGEAAPPTRKPERRSEFIGQARAGASFTAIRHPKTDMPRHGAWRAQSKGGDMKLLGYGERGPVTPGLLDAGGRIRDPSGRRCHIAGSVLLPTGRRGCATPIPAPAGVGGKPRSALRRWSASSSASV